MKNHAFHIDSTARTIRLVDCKNLADMQRLVGGSICVAAGMAGGDVLYVDDEGLFKPATGFFRFDGQEQPLAGNGLVVGEEVEEADGTYYTKDPAITLEQLEAKVRFVDREHVDAWGKANASEPAMSFTSFNEDGTQHTEVLKTYGAVIGSIPRADEPGDDK